MDKSTIQLLLIKAIKSNSPIQKEALRSVMSEINTEESKNVLTPDRIISIVRKEMVKFKDAAESFKNKDQHLFDKYCESAIFLESLLPMQISEDKFQDIVNEFAHLTFPEIMKSVKAKYGNSINMKNFVKYINKT